MEWKGDLSSINCFCRYAFASDVFHSGAGPDLLVLFVFVVVFGGADMPFSLSLKFYQFGLLPRDFFLIYLASEHLWSLSKKKFQLGMLEVTSVVRRRPTSIVSRRRCSRGWSYPSPLAFLVEFDDDDDEDDDDNDDYIDDDIDDDVERYPFAAWFILLPLLDW